MARIHIDSDDELPELADLLKALKQSPRKKAQPKTIPKEHSPETVSSTRGRDPSDPRAESRTIKYQGVKNTEPEKSTTTKPRQRVLRKVNDNIHTTSISKESIRVTASDSKLNSERIIPAQTPRRLYLRPKQQELKIFEDESEDASVRVKNCRKDEDNDEAFIHDSEGSSPSPTRLFHRPASKRASEMQRPSSGLKSNAFQKSLLPYDGNGEDIPFAKRPVIPATMSSRPTSSSSMDKPAFLL
jgi:hypothetical protein